MPDVTFGVGFPGSLENRMENAQWICTYFELQSQNCSICYSLLIREFTE